MLNGFERCILDNKERLADMLLSLGIKNPPEVFYYDSISSTNGVAKAVPIGAMPDGLYIAKAQSAGRGRLGRSFVSDEGGLYMTLRFERNLPPVAATRATVYTAVAVCRAVEGLTGLSPKIKWVNDVLLGGKKLAGILCEGIIGDGGMLSVLAVGIGINVLTAPKGEIAEIATALCEHTRDCPDPIMLAAAVTQQMYVMHNMQFSDVLNLYRERSVIPGKRVRVIKPACEYFATAVEIDDDGALVIKTDGGVTEHLATGEVSVREL